MLRGYLLAPMWAGIACLSIASAAAQDLNIQTELEILAPSPAISPPPPRTKKIVEVPQFEPEYKAEIKEKSVNEIVGELNTLNPKEKARLLQFEVQDGPNAVTFDVTQGGKNVDIMAPSIQALSPDSLTVGNFRYTGPKVGSSERDAFAALLIAAKKDKDADKTKQLVPTGRQLLTGYKPKEVSAPPKITTTASVASSYRYDSNVFSTPANAIGDRYLSVVPKVKVVVPTGEEGAAFSFVVSSTSARYDEQNRKDRDILLGEVGYSKTLYSKTPDPNSATKQTESVGLTFTSRASYLPGYSGPGVKSYAPKLGWDLSGIPIGDHLCGRAKSSVNCFTAGVSAAISRTWYGSDSTAKNYGFEAGAAFSWNILGPELVLGVSGNVSDNLYDDFPGGRNDVTFNYGPALTWTPPDANLVLSATATFYNNVSTLDAAEFDKGIFIPQVTGSLKF